MCVFSALCVESHPSWSWQVRVHMCVCVCVCFAAKKRQRKSEVDRGGQIKEIGSLGPARDGQIKHDTSL